MSNRFGGQVGHRMKSPKPPLFKTRAVLIAALFLSAVLNSNTPDGGRFHLLMAIFFFTGGMLFGIVAMDTERDWIR
jgi:hypothetical protein